MLLVVARIREGWVRNRLRMAILAGCCKVHTVGRVMINVMGKQIKGSTVVDIAVTLGTVAGDPAVL